jgi:N-acetylglucosaminyl-diphospho-decaprenol L-rhamnosyltransferase
MDTKLRISVVIPTYETRERTLRCLAALWLCNPQPDEVIVVDDGSPDNTAPSVIRKYPRHIVVRLPRRRGLAAAANYGLARASGDLLLLLDSDTEVDGSAIGAVLSAFEARDDLGVAGAALRYPNGGRRWSGGRLPGSLWCFAQASGLPSILEHSKLSRWLRSHFVSRTGRVDWVPGTAMVVRRSLWEEIGPFDLGYRLRGQYIDLCCNAADAGSKIEIIPGFGVVHPASGSTSSNGFAPSISGDRFMWTDLVRFAAKRSGDAGARRSGRALQLGGRLRLFGRRVATPLVPWERKQEWQAETIACGQALRAVDAAFTSHRPQP